MSKSFKKQRRWEEDEYEDDYRQKQKNNDRRKLKKMKNDLRSLKNVSTKDLHYYEDDE